jgi:hypothetical protein
MDSVVAVRSRWLTPGAIKLHVLLVVLVVPMLALGVWQLERAMDGHTRSWAYAVQWPAFAAYAVYMWWNLLRDQPGFGRRRPDPTELEALRAEQADEDLGPGPRHIPGPDSPPDGMTSMPRRLRR